MFREACAFIRVDGKMGRLPAYFDNPEKVIQIQMLIPNFHSLTKLILYPIT